MPFNSEKHQRRSIRLKEYDYSQPGSYFVTICTYGLQKLFGDICTTNSEGAGLEPARTEISNVFLNNYGKIVLNTWCDLVNHISGIKLGEFVIMPNHVHGIIHIIDPETEWDAFIPSNFKYYDVGNDTERAGFVNAGSVRAGSKPAPHNQVKQTPLSEIIRQFKTFSTRKINQVRKTPGVPVWKRDYFEHIIRDQESYEKIVDYIQNNPLMWESDELFNE